MLMMIDHMTQFLSYLVSNIEVDSQSYDDLD